MNVILNVETLAHPVTGIGRYTSELLRELVNNSSIDQIQCNLGSFLFDSEQFLSHKKDEIIVKKNRPFQRIRELAHSIPLFTDLKIGLQNRAFFKKTKNLKETIYHEPNYILKPFNGPCVVSVHDLSFLHFPQYHPKARIKYFKRAFLKSLLRADQIITDSKFIKRELITLLEISPSKITAIPLGCSGLFFPRQKQETYKILDQYDLNHGDYLLSVATFEPRKNFKNLIQAYIQLSKSLKKKYPLILVGDQGWGLLDLQKEIENLEKQGELRRLGYVPKKHLPFIYAGARGFVYPSIYEGFGLPLLEAMACGIPIMYSNTSSMPEVAGNTGLMVDPMNTKSILNGLNRLLVDETFRISAKQRGPIQASNFTWEKCVAKTLKVYNQAILKHRQIIL